MKTLLKKASSLLLVVCLSCIMITQLKQKFPPALPFSSATSIQIRQGLMAKAPLFHLNQSVVIGVPAPVAGQYYETGTWYSNNKLYIRVKVWRDKEAFDTGERALYDSYNYAAATLPDF